jgi:PAS domain S-box-containing protein
MALVPMHPDDRSAMHAIVSASIGSGRHEREYRVVPRPGELRWLRSRGKIYRDAHGAAVRMTGSLADITEPKLAADALRESEARFRNLTEISSDFFWETDAEHRYSSIEFGEAYVGIRDLSFKLGRARWEIPSPSPDEAGWAAHRAVLAAHQRFLDFGFSRMENGKERFYEISGEPRFDARGGFLGYRGVGRDVTERKRAEMALRKSEERYARAMEASGDGHTDWNIETGEVYVSPRYLEICGLPRDTTFRDRAEWVQAFPFHPEDRAKWEAAVAAHFASRGTRFREEMRIVVRGETRWLDVTYVCRRDATGRPIRWTNSSADITERKCAEEELRRSKNYLAEAQKVGHTGSWAWSPVSITIL